MDHERNNRNNNGSVGARDVDWSRFGLNNSENKRSDRGREEFGPEMYQTGTNELFAQEYVSYLSALFKKSLVKMCTYIYIVNLIFRTRIHGGSQIFSYLNQLYSALGMVYSPPV